MTTRILPHREADPSSVHWGPWWLHLNSNRVLADQLITGWDYSTPMAFELQPSVDEDLFLESTGLASLHECEIVAICECATTGYRFEARRSLADLTIGADKVLSVEPPLGTLAHKVSLSASIVLAHSTLQDADDIACRRGARLAGSSRHNVTLEGSGARFPTEAVRFSTLGFPNALWSLNCDFHDAEEPLTSSVRLMINTEHPRSDALLDPSHPEHRLLSSALEVDIVRRMVRAAAVEEAQFRGNRPWPEGSTGEALENMSELYFGKTIHELVTLRRVDPEAYERTLQARMNFFGAS